MDSNNNRAVPEAPGTQNWLDIVREQVSSLRFGVVEIVVHDSKVVQIEKTERVRLDRAQSDFKSSRARQG
jgi:hypothetical protein